MSWANFERAYSFCAVTGKKTQYPVPVKVSDMAVNQARLSEISIILGITFGNIIETLSAMAITCTELHNQGKLYVEPEHDHGMHFIT